MVRINHRRAHVAMSEFPNRLKIVPALQQVCGECMAKGAAARSPRDPRLAY